ncbi:5-methylcytosine restriction system specificity protein McrC [Rhizobium sp. 814_E9_N1_1]|uniref:5-methylcytosine restriction system specificity protein McrC n=1 Tax=unclassified Rhizobium TaxID=2613769 RepID=UPI003F271C41
MNIPISNIYYLLLYAWGHFQPGAVKDVGVTESPDLPNLFARILIDRSHSLLRRGLDRGYKGVVEETKAPRGRLVINQMAVRQTLLRGYAVCEADELTYDVLHNQILLTTILNLAACGDVKSDTRHELRATAARIHGVTRIRLTADIFHRVQLSRNTSQYGLLMKVCEFVFCSLMPDQRGTGSRFQDILEDETRMAAVFEDFLRGFYRAELPDCSVGSEIMPWHASAVNGNDLQVLPTMQTDITIRAKGNTTIVDAKYYREALGGGRFTPRLRSAHLYQLTTYLAHAQNRQPGTKVRGVLIYPMVQRPLKLQYHLLGFPVVISTVNLAADWAEIRNELLTITA